MWPIKYSVPTVFPLVVYIWQFTGSWLLFHSEGKVRDEFNLSPTLMYLLVALVRSIWYLKVFLN